MGLATGREGGGAHQEGDIDHRREKHRAHLPLVVTEAGSYLRLIDSCITQLKAQGPSRTCNESKEEEEGGVHTRKEILTMAVKNTGPTSPLHPLLNETWKLPADSTTEKSCKRTDTMRPQAS